MIQKPSYSTTKLGFWVSSAMAWLVILILIVAAVLGSKEAVGLVPFVLPLMVALIVSILGIHRGFGSLDMRTMAGAAGAGPEGGAP